MKKRKARGRKGGGGEKWQPPPHPKEATLEGGKVWGGGVFKSLLIFYPKFEICDVWLLYHRS